jgi:hypothetical protein
MTKLTTLAFLAVTLSVTTAGADPLPAGYATLGVEAGGVAGGFANAVDVGGGVKLGETPVFARAQLASGSFDDISEAVGSQSSDRFYQGSGTFKQARLGAEVLHCSSTGWICGLAGADLGVLHTSSTSGPTTDTMSSTYTQESVIPRVGADMGGRHLRVRTTAEVAYGHAQRDRGSESKSDAGGQGLMLGAAVAYRF